MKIIIPCKSYEHAQILITAINLGTESTAVLLTSSLNSYEVLVESKEG